MNPILSQLSNSATKNLAPTDMGKTLRVDVPNTTTSPRFFDVMSQKGTEKIADFISQSFDLGANQMPQSVSAEDITLSVEAPGEVGNHAVSTDKNTLATMLGDVNSDLNRLDSMVDIVSSGVKLSQRDLIAMQAFMAKSMLATETFSRGIAEVGKSLMNTLNMQV